MARRSSMVYNLLRSEQRETGFTPKEIMDRVSQTYEITPGKGLRKQVAVALKRGIDFGIITRKNNKYRFDPGSTGVIHEYAPKKSTVSAKHDGRRSNKKLRRNRKRGNAHQTNKKNNKHRTLKQKRDRASMRTSGTPLPPRPVPRVPKPPNWNPKRRNLCEEPISKVIKHPSNNNVS